MVTLLYKRQNIVEEVIADLFGVAQGTVSEIITEFTPLIAQATEEFRPDAEEAKQMTRGRIALVDGTLWPCWSWERALEMSAGKYKTTGHGSLIISDEFGEIILVSDAAAGCVHDMKKREGEVKEILDLAGSVIADKGFQGSGYVTPTKKPQGRELYMVNTNTITRSVLSALPSSARLRISRPGKSFSPIIGGRSTRFLIHSTQPSAYISSNRVFNNRK